jgi:hypothetical protein
LGSKEKAPTPLLRYLEGNTLKLCAPGVAILGKPVHTDGEVVIIDGARQRRSAIYLADLAELTDAVGGESVTLGLFLDAIEHGDQIRVGLTRDRITYDNPAQIARIKAGN